eukprot:763601-Hanusia_phi.AAC.9
MTLPHPLFEAIKVKGFNNEVSLENPGPSAKPRVRYASVKKCSYKRTRAERLDDGNSGEEFELVPWVLKACQDGGPKKKRAGGGRGL